MASSKEYISQLKQLISLTLSEKIYWMQLNQTTYYFQDPSMGRAGHTATIQRVPNSSPSRYIFQIQDNLSKEIKVDVVTDGTAQIDTLAVLYDNARKAVQRRSQSFFNEFLNKLDLPDKSNTV